MTQITYECKKALTGSDAPCCLQAQANALQLLLQQLVFVLDAQGTLDADALDRWLHTCTDRMHATGSAPAADVAALRRLHAAVLA